MKVLLGLRTAALVASSAALLAGCGGVHPGAAADLDGYRIPLETVDAQTAALCAVGPQALGVAEGQQVDVRSLRQYVLDEQMGLRQAELAAEELGLEVPMRESSLEELEQVLASRGASTEGLAPEEVEAFVAFAQDSQRAAQLRSAVDEELTGQPPAAGQEISAETMELLEAQVDVAEVDPRFGADAASSGSLSVPVSENAQVPSLEDANAMQSFLADRPAEQSCG